MSLLTAILATYRLAHMIVEEDGPGGIFIEFRTWAADQGGLIEKGANCPFCVSFWASWAVALLLANQGLRGYVLHALAATGGTVLLYETLEALENASS